MKKIYTKERLPLYIALGFVLGIVLGIFFPKFSTDTQVVGDIYLKLLKMMITPIMFLTVCHGIMQMSHMKELRRLGGKTILTFVVMFIASSLVALAVVMAIRPGRGLELSGAPEFTEEIVNPTLSMFLMNLVPENPIKDFAEGNILPIMVFAALFSTATVAIGEKAKPIKDLIRSLMDVMFKLLDFVMATSPIGVLSLMASSVANYGSGLFSAIGMYIITCYIACFFTFIVVMVLPSITYGGIAPKTFFKGIGKLWPVTLATTSSAASLGAAITICRDDYQLPSRVTSFVLPLGNTINMCGGACSFTCLAIFAADFYGIPLTAAQIISLIIVATFINMSAPGIPGGGIILGASFLSILGLPIHIMGPIAAIYRLLDMAFTTLNVTGDVSAAIVLSKKESCS